MEIDVQKVIEAYSREIGTLTHRAILAETLLENMRSAPTEEPESI